MTFAQPIFILASPRSFTSLSCAMLGQHPDLYGVPELNLFLADTLGEWYDTLKDQSAGRKLHGVLRTVAQLYSGEQTIESIQMARRWIMNRLDWTTGEVYQELCRKAYPLHIIDKTPAYSIELENMERIRNAFPDAHYLHLVRHPRTQGNSVMKLLPDLKASKKRRKSLSKTKDSISPTLMYCMDREANPPTLDFQLLWYRMQWKIMRFLETIPPEKQIRLRGEDLLADTKLYFEKLCRFWGVSWSEEAYEAMLHPEDSPYACFGPWGANFGNDPNFLSSPYFKPKKVAESYLEGPLPWRKDQGEFLPAVVEMAHQLGYK